MELKISNEIKLPKSTATQKLAWLGTTGSGKTYGASKLAEQFWHIGAQFVVLDPVGVWYGLRLSEDGKKPSHINIPIFGGLHGDVPLEPTAGELLANLVVDKGLSCIIDVSQFESDSDKARFASAFANRFFFRKKAAPSAVHLFLEECQEFVPQNPQKGEERMLHAFIRMQKLGRNFGIGSSYITQRPQEVNKKALNMCQTLFVFRTTGTHERTAIEKWIEDKSLDESIANDLPKISTGSCHVWSPEFLKISAMAHILKKETFNASATPEVGSKAKSRKLAPIDLEKVRTEMAATIEKAKGEDPKLLQIEVRKLKEQLVAAEKIKATNSSAPAAMGVSQWMEYGKKYKYDNFFSEKIIKDTEKRMNIEFMAERDEFLRHIKNMFKIIETVAITVKDIKMPDFKKISTKTKEYKAIFDTPSPDWMSKKGERLSYKMDSVVIPPSMQKTAEKIINSVPDNTQGTITAGAKNMLKVLVSRYPMKLTWVQVATFAKLKSSTGSYSTNKTSLRNAGMIIEEGDLVQASQAAIDLMGHEVSAPQSSQEIREMWSNSFTGATKKMFDHLVSVYPGMITREELAAAAGVKHTTGSYSTNLSMLRSNNLIVERDQELKLNDNLFI